MIKKSAVKLQGMTEASLGALLECERVYQRHGLEALITSAKDQPKQHSPKSSHKDGRAFDLRLPSRMVFEKYFGRGSWDGKSRKCDREIVRELREALGDGFVVLLERHQANPWSWHIHVQERRA